MNWKTDLLLHIGVFLPFITIYYFTAIMAMQRASLTRDIATTTEDLMQPLQNTRSGQGQSFDLQQLLAHADVDTSKNETIVLEIATIVPVVSVLLLGACVLFARRHGDSLWHVLREAVILVAMYTIVESIITAGFLFQLVNFDSQFLVQQLSNAIFFWYNPAGGWTHISRTCHYTGDALHTLFPAFY